MSYYYVLCVFVGCIPMVVFGYNTSILNTSQNSIHFGSSSSGSGSSGSSSQGGGGGSGDTAVSITQFQWSLAVSCYCVGGFVGSFVTGSIVDTYGRLKCLQYILVSNLVLGIASSGSTCMTMFIGCRFFLGIVGGSSTVVTPIYLSEITPTLNSRFVTSIPLKGIVGTMTQLSCVVGILLSGLWSLPFVGSSDDTNSTNSDDVVGGSNSHDGDHDDHDGTTADSNVNSNLWRFIFLPIPILSFLGLLVCYVYSIPESPIWTIQQYTNNNNNRNRNYRNSTAARSRVVSQGGREAATADELDTEAEGAQAEDAASEEGEEDTATTSVALLEIRSNVQDTMLKFFQTPSTSSTTPNDNTDIDELIHVELQRMIRTMSRMTTSTTTATNFGNVVVTSAVSDSGEGDGGLYSPPSITMGPNDNTNSTRDEDVFHDEDEEDTESRTAAVEVAPGAVAASTNPPSSFYDYVFDPKNRVAIFSSILYPVVQQLSGINAVFYYSTSFFENLNTGGHPEYGTILIFVINVVATYIVAFYYMDQYGRKSLLATSCIGMFVCCIIITISLIVLSTSSATSTATTSTMMIWNYVTVISVVTYVVFFEVGLGCIPFFIISELVPSSSGQLGKIQSIAMSCNWFCNFLVGMFFPYLDELLHHKYTFLPFATILLATSIYTIFVLPETMMKR